MFAINMLDETNPENGGANYIWLVLIVFLLMVILGWLVSKKGWLKKEEAAPSEHGHEDQNAVNEQAQAQPVKMPIHGMETKAIQVNDQQVNASIGGVGTPIVQEHDQQVEAPVSSLGTAVVQEHDQQVETPVRGMSIPTKDDLTLIEGIGPKVAKLLSDIGITTFNGLANSDIGKVREALNNAGYKYMDPATWPEQANLAAKGEMEGLKRLQESLKGGRKVN